MGCANAKTCLPQAKTGDGAGGQDKRKAGEQAEPQDAEMETVEEDQDVGMEHAPQVPRLSLHAGQRRGLEIDLGEGSTICTTVAEYMASKILDKAWVSQHDDVAYYCKVPLALLEVGKSTEARESLNVAVKYLERGGAGSECASYSGNHVQAPWLWICWAAARLQCDSIVETCCKKIGRFKEPMTDTGLVKSPYTGFRATDYEFDFLATAMLCKAAMLQGSWSAAREAGDSLLRTIGANQLDMRNRRRFSLRWRWNTGFLQVQDEYHCIVQGSPDQLYNMLGLPAVVLLELSTSRALEQRKEASAYREGALTLLAFLKDCVGIHASPHASAVAFAATLAGDADLQRRLTGQLVQRCAGTAEVGTREAETPERFDQLAETCIWLAQVSKLRKSRSLVNL